MPDLHRPAKGCVFTPRCPKVQSVCRTQSSQIQEISSAVNEVEHSDRCHLHDPELSHVFTIPETQLQNGRNRFCTTEAAGSTGDLNSLLEISQLRVRYENMSKLRAMLTSQENWHIDAVLDVSLKVRKGETLGLVGECGSGKTTLGLSVLGLNKVHSGSVKIQRDELVGLSQRQYKPVRKNISMMIQDPVGSLSPRRTIEQRLIEPFKTHGVKTESYGQEAKRLCDMVSLSAKILTRCPHELSGGQARRVSVARALALNPALIIADEPSAGLDDSVQGEILNLMMDIEQQHNLGYLIISFNLPVIRQISDRLAIMYLSRIVEKGNCEQIFAKPGHPYSEALVNGTSNPDPAKRRELMSIEGEIPSLTNRPRSCDFHPKCRYAQDACQEIEPIEHVLFDGRTVRCHFPLVA